MPLAATLFWEVLNRARRSTVIKATSKKVPPVKPDHDG